MATYILTCVEHGDFTISRPMSEGPGDASCAHCARPVSRNYGAEGVGFAVAALARARDNGASTNREMRDLFLETAEEAATPDDPDGSKAIRQWNETHDPKPGNSKPLRPEMPLHSKSMWGGFGKKET